MIQIRHPLTGRWVKLSTENGRIIATKKTPGPWKGVPVHEGSR